jgi:hypothetical protein
MYLLKNTDEFALLQEEIGITSVTIECMSKSSSYPVTIIHREGIAKVIEGNLMPMQ